jgi:hypothetical protein
MILPMCDSVTLACKCIKSTLSPTASIRKRTWKAAYELRIEAASKLNVMLVSGKREAQSQDP